MKKFSPLAVPPLARWLLLPPRFAPYFFCEVVEPWKGGLSARESCQGAETLNGNEQAFDALSLRFAFQLFPTAQPRRRKELQDKVVKCFFWF